MRLSCFVLLIALSAATAADPAPPYPRSPVIRGLDWAPADTVIRQARDGCLRSAMTYCPGLKRYLWWQQVPQPPGHRDRGDTRFTGGFGVYDAPEPWGSWTTAYFTPKWDVGPGEHADFPSKWMSADGRTLHLVFSGDDCFCARRATVWLASDPSR
jgi:hypothetical protein